MDDPALAPLAIWIPGIIAGVLAVVAVVFFLLWRSALASARRAREAAAASSPEVHELALAEAARRDRIAHDSLVGTATSLTSVIDRAESIAITAEQDHAAAARSARELAEQLRVVRDDVRRVGDLVEPPAAGDDAEAAVDLSALSVEPLVPTAGSVSMSMTQLVVRAHDAGLHVRIETVGEPFAVPSSFAVAAMRIVEIALQNAAVHAGEGATATVTATWTDDALRISIEDDGVRAAAIREGRDPDASLPADDADRLAMLTGADGPGIAEMRERATAHDGVFSATIVPGIGFTVTATFPGIRRAAIAADGHGGA